MSNKTEKKIINNVIKSVEFALDQIAFDKNVSYSDSDNKQDFFILNLVIVIINKIFLILNLVIVIQKEVV